MIVLMIAVKRCLMDKILPTTSKRLRTPEGRWGPALNAFRETNRRRCVNKVVIDNLITSVRCIRNNGGRIENLLQPKIVWFCAECPGSSGSSQWRSQPKNLGGGPKMFDFRRITLFCLEKRLSKHKMAIFSKQFLGGPWPLCPPPGYAYGSNRSASYCWGRAVVAALHARCTRNGMCAKNSIYICVCVARTRSKSKHGVWFLLLLAVIVWSFAPLPLGLCDRNRMVLWPGCEGHVRCNHHKGNVRSVRFCCKKGGMSLTPLRRHGVECAIHPVFFVIHLFSKMTEKKLNSATMPFFSHEKTSKWKKLQMFQSYFGQKDWNISAKRKTQDAPPTGCALRTAPICVQSEQPIIEW